MDGSDILPWTLAVQLGAAALITLFFYVSARSPRRPEVDLWLFAWIWETIAVLASLFFVVNSSDPESGVLTWPWRPMVFFFVTAKTLFALFVVRGLRRHFRPKEALRRPGSHLLYFALFWALLLALVSPRAIHALPLQWLLVAMVMILGGVGVLRQNPDRGSRSLPSVVLIVGALYLSYVPFTLPILWGAAPLIAQWSGSSLLDAGADIVLAMAMLGTIERSRTARLEDIYHRLQDSYDSLRKLADVDPLTGLNSRRMLRQVLEEVNTGSLVSIEIDDFDELNSIYGHEIGDSCLTWTARTLSRAFRPTDHVFRFGGQEFLVVAPGCAAGKTEERMRAVGVIIGQGTSIRPPIAVSYGIAELAEGESPEAALREANRRRHEMGVKRRSR